jgi:hypothetical protein
MGDRLDEAATAALACWNPAKQLICHHPATRKEWKRNNPAIVERAACD